MRSFKKVLVTGGAGFIGSHLVKRILNFTDWEVSVLDSLTYAGDFQNLKGAKIKNFFKIDICDDKLHEDLIKYQFDAILHLAAESHVDRSIEDPNSFLKTNVNGTVNLLDLALKYHKQNPNFIFYHVSTDEVYGSLEIDDETGFSETTSYDPRSPYSASKAASDHFVRAYHHTYGLPVLISNCSNNYGTHQYPEKLIPVVIDKLIKREPIPVYGKGENMRDWLHVSDHTEAILTILKKGKIGETYCIGGENCISNIELVKSLCRVYDSMKGTNSEHLITFVEDRKGHDLKYSINIDKIRNELSWQPSVSFTQGLRETVQWYIEKSEEKKNVFQTYCNLFLDDYRDPIDAFSYTGDPVFKELQWDIVRNYSQFVKFVEDWYEKHRTLPQLIAFDHDLDDAHYQHLTGEFPYEDLEKTGMHAARWLVEFCMDKNLKLPDFRVHSMNPVGKANIQSILENFKSFQGN